MKKRLTRISAIILTAAVVAGGAGGVNAFAATTSHAPTDAKTVDTTIVTATAHRAASPLPDMLGANVPSGYGMINGYGSSTIAQNAIGNFALEVWGSSLNDQPDPYWWNYYCSFNGVTVSDSIKLLNADGQGSPIKADTNTSNTYGGVSASISTKPDVLIGVDVSNSYTGSYAGYDTQIATIQASDASYAPQKARYNPTYLEDMIDSVYEAADAIETTGKATRYSKTPSEIAEEYESYILGIRGYIENQIGEDYYKTIAIVSGVSTSGGVNTYTIDGPGSNGATSTNRYVEYTYGYTNNITNNASDTATSATLAGVDAIIITSDTVEAAIKKDTTITAATNAPELISVNELDTLYGVYMNSVENALGMGYILGRIYDQDDASGFLSAQNLYKYYAEKFYHIKSTELETILSKGTKEKMEKVNENLDLSVAEDKLLYEQNNLEMDRITSDVTSDKTYYAYDGDTMKTKLAEYAAQ